MLFSQAEGVQEVIVDRLRRWWAFRSIAERSAFEPIFEDRTVGTFAGPEHGYEV
jgi:hypothetical protein